MTCNNSAKALPGVIACGSVAEPRCRVGRRLRGCHSQPTDVAYDVYEWMIMLTSIYYYITTALYVESGLKKVCKYVCIYVLLYHLVIYVFSVRIYKINIYTVYTLINILSRQAIQEYRMLLRGIDSRGEICLKFRLFRYALWSSFLKIKDKERSDK